MFFLKITDIGRRKVSVARHGKYAYIYSIPAIYIFYTCNIYILYLQYIYMYICIYIYIYKENKKNAFDLCGRGVGFMNIKDIKDMYTTMSLRREYRIVKLMK